jgi:hypothetical protein
VLCLNVVVCVCGVLVSNMERVGATKGAGWGLEDWSPGGRCDDVHRVEACLSNKCAVARDTMVFILYYN